MKDNLKTYPTDGEWMSAYRWKERFKKELQKRFSKIGWNSNELRKLIEEILGQ